MYHTLQKVLVVQSAGDGGVDNAGSDAHSFRNHNDVTYVCRCAVNAIHALSWPQHTAPAGSRARTSNSGTKDLTTSSSRPTCSWRLLTGHDCGQLLLWHPAAARLAPLIRIGEPFSPIKVCSLHPGSCCLAQFICGRGPTSACRHCMRTEAQLYLYQIRFSNTPPDVGVLQRATHVFVGSNW
jgi:hypothetical protein